MKEIIKKWDKMLYDVCDNKFNLKLFKQTMKESFNIVYKKAKERTMDFDTAILLIKMAIFSRCDSVSKKQRVAQYVVFEILSRIENGFNDEEIKEGKLILKASFFLDDLVTINLGTFDLTDFYEYLEWF